MENSVMGINAYTPMPSKSDTHPPQFLVALDATANAQRMCTPNGVQPHAHRRMIHITIQWVGYDMPDYPPPSPSEPPPKLLDQVRDRVRRLGYAKRTELSYVHWIKRFILFHDKRHPKEMGKPEVEAF